ncbi:glycosyltransferase family 2 protein [Acuticoccus sp. I52.16.1]|uniref:glycosyltransferase family 2 protein n=1 Tax=Acuticoccus sp. I52.16.1 TaxID=2928472 RepID=UPI001FD2D5BD|nr:glycosyltransferase family 2 protein [Acuticoccus sp. I52.16.1]UOM36754.1 glycosyltransferase family 2 protein [Acuticoccus sp. I52.16.1]
MNAVLPVSVVIPTRNEARNLPGCLRCLSRFAEVVVVDSGSTDETAAIAKHMGARLIPFAWNGRYPKKRNHILINERLAAPWVLFLDADEQIPETFCDELARTLPGSDRAGYWINYTNHFMGRELKHGVPQRKLALIRVGRGLFERIEEDGWSTLDMEIHEHPVLDGPTGEIAARIDHRDFRGLDRFFTRHIDYARWEARRHEVLHNQGLGSAAHLTKRQRFKYANLDRWWYPFFYFAVAYFLKRGLLDGRAGFDYALYKLWYFNAIRGLIDEQRRAPHEG